MLFRERWHQMINTALRMKELATERGISLRKLSELADVPYSTLKSAQQYNRQLSVDTIERLCVGLQIPISDFFAEVKGAG